MEEKDYILLGAYAKDLKEKLLTFQSLVGNFCCKSSKIGLKTYKLYNDSEKIRSLLHDLSVHEAPNIADNLDVFYGCDETSNLYIKEQKKILEETNWNYKKIRKYIEGDK